MMLTSHVISLFGVALLLWLALRRFRFRITTIAHLPGPQPGSWLVGNLPDILRPINVGDADFAWMKLFGNSLRIKGMFGSDVLFTADPKAFQYILSCYNFPRSPEFRFWVKLFGGRGLNWAEGAQHSRQRKLMESAFTYPNTREHLPLFRQIIQQTVVKWKDIIANSGSMSADLDIIPWMDRTTLDIIGATGFDYHVGALEEESSELYQAYSNLFVNTFLQRSDATLVFEAMCGILPEFVISAILSVTPDKTIEKVRSYKKIALRVARSLVDRQLDFHVKGEENGKDILSLLVRTNLSVPSENSMTDEELLAQVTSLMVAGHESTASTMTWVLYELSKRLTFQGEIRDEIKAARTRAKQRGDIELTAADLESMPLLGAALKETLRYHPILPQMLRVAGCEAVVPLSGPLRTTTGEMITSIPVKKGQSVILSIAAFNRLATVWGNDADTWRPQRFLEETEEKQKNALGVIANIATFSLGVRSCIGWRFAMLNMQAMLAELVENFEFSPPEVNVEIIRAATTTMSPMVKGSKEGRAELPLRVTPVM